jgi:hypothetical protein
MHFPQALDYETRQKLTFFRLQICIEIEEILAFC